MVLSAASSPDAAPPFAVLVKRIVRPVLVCVAITLVLVVARGVFAANIQASMVQHVAVEHDLNRAHGAMLDQQTGVRGWLLTGEARFLDPYQAGNEDLMAANAALLGRLLDLGNRELTIAVQGVWQAQQRWSSEWAVPVVNGEMVTPGRIATEKRLFDEYRARFAAANEIADSRITALQRLDRTILLGGVSFQVLLLVGSGLVVWRQFRRLQGAVVAPIEALLDGVKRIGNGEYTSHLPMEGPRELRALSEGVAQMAIGLQRSECDRQARELSTAQQADLNRQVLDLAHEFTARLDVCHVLDAVVRGFSEVSGAGSVRVWLRERESMVLTRCTGSEPMASTDEIGDGIVGRAALHGTAFFRHEALERRAETALPSADALAIPLVGGGTTQGVIELVGGDEPLVLGMRLPAFKTLAAQAGVALAAAQLHQQTVELGRTDALTGVSNRRTFDEDLGNEASLALRSDRHLSAVLVDIDYFKMVNDTYGHIAGDEALRELADLMRSMLRDSDSVYRYGGEEFVLLLRDTDEQGAHEAAERLRRDVERAFAHRAPSFTVSCGVATLGEHISSSGALVAAADQAMYEAKSSGRNRVVTASGLAVPLGVPVQVD
jgi:diguanylate cyclase (GGDEF)-like protein